MITDFRPLFRRSLPGKVFQLFILGGLLASSGVAQTSYQWQLQESDVPWGSWATGTWSPAGPADGVGNTANFGALDVTVTSTVTLDGSFQIGNLIFGDQNAASSASWVLAPGTGGALTLATTSGTPTITVNTLGSGASATITAPLAGTAGLVKDGSGNLILSGVNTYTGTTRIAAGTLTATSAALNNTALDFAGGTLRVNGNAATLGNAIAVSANSTLTFGSGSNFLSNTVSSASSDVKLLISQGNGAANTVTFGTAASFASYLGTIELGNKFFRFDSSYNGAQAGASAIWQVNPGAQLSYRAGTNATQTIQLGGLQGAGTLSGGDSAGSGFVNYQIGARNTDTEFSGVIKDGLTRTSLTKAGSGTLKLSGINSYTGATSVNAGRLVVTGSVAASALTVNGVTAILAGNGTVGAITLTLGSLQPGLDGIGTLDGASLTWNPAASLGFDLGAVDGISDGISLTGAFNAATAGTFTFDFSGGVAGNTYTLVEFGSGLTNFSVGDFSASGIEGIFNLDAAGGKLTFTAVPEPQAWALAAVGLAALMLGRRRRRSRSHASRQNDAMDA